MRLLEKRPADHPQSAKEVLHELDAMAAAASGGTLAVPSAEPTAQPTVPRRGLLGYRAAAYLGLAAVLGLLGYAALARTTDRPVARGPSVSAAGSTSVPASAERARSIAVLPFVNMSAEPAIVRLRNTLDLHPRYTQARDWLGRTYLLKGMHAEALAEQQTAASLAGRGSMELATLAYAYAVTDRREQALGIRAELEERSRRQYVSPLVFARVSTGLGEKDQAFVWLDKAVAAHDPNLLFGVLDPLWDPVRSDPRFTRALRRMRLES